MTRIQQLGVGAALALACTLVAAQGLRTIAFEVFDADTDRRLEVDLLVDGTKLQQGQYELKADQDSMIAIEVATLAEQAYYPRKFTIFLANIAETRAAYRIYLARRGEAGARYSRGSVAQAAAHLSPKTVDRATVLLERIDVEAPKSGTRNQFWIYLQYNLGRAHFVNCTYRFIDSCGDAKTIFDNLLTMLPEEPRLFEAERISKELLTQLDIERHELVNRYRRARWDLQRGRPDAALEAFEALAALARSDPAVARHLGVGVEQLDKDAAFARSRVQSAAAGTAAPAAAGR